MRLYPELPARRMSTVVRDGVLLLLLILFAWLGLKVHDAVDELSVLGTGVKEVGDAVPFVGDPVKDLGERGEDSVHRLANVLGLVIFGIPALLLLWRMLPDRIAQIPSGVARSHSGLPSRFRMVSCSLTRPTRSETSLRSATTLSSRRLLRMPVFVPLVRNQHSLLARRVEWFSDARRCEF